MIFVVGQEKDRQDGPRISEPQWDAVLRDSGFSGLDLCVQDYPGKPTHSSKITCDLKRAGFRLLTLVQPA